MKLYYGVNACSLAVLITALEADIPVELVKVDIYHSPHTTADGRDYSEVNPKLYVPILEFSDGRRLSEVAVQLQYLADQAQEYGLAPDRLSDDRYRLQEWLNYISSELHKSFSPWLFHSEVGQPAQEAARNKIAFRLRLIEERLRDHQYLMGGYTIADAYLFTILAWSAFAKVPLDEFPNIRTWQARVGARPAVVEALRRHV
ncbi:glutathione binding-like protein [Aminobacter anthyllidis]|uniref:glutathione binding-like protein n=1 Tax=Aminobacter anthyllidis TaxID=1035067 RepID=UPI0024553042|nr:glutathione binding-like protein [Aminobacter anthyllidis]MDH4984339.1 glutathione binding-like protein [Aminobacter anthyllidis]